MKTKEVLEILQDKYRLPEWAFFAELRAGTGYTYHKGRNPEQRFDAWVLNCWPSKKFLSIAFEIKVSRGDFLGEIKQPKKRKQAILLSNEFYFVTPPGLVKKDEIPEDCGWMEITKRGKLHRRKKSPFNEKPHLDWGLLASIARRSPSGSESQYEEMKKRISYLESRNRKLQETIRSLDWKRQEDYATIDALKGRLKEHESDLKCFCK